MFPIVMIGGGGHASVLTEILLAQGRDILAVISPEDISQRSIFNGMVHLKSNEDMLAYSTEKVLLVNGIGMMPKLDLKLKVNEYFLSLGYQFETVIADSACVSPFSKVEPGAQILPMAIVQAGATIGSHSIVNTGVLIEHDSNVGEYSHIAPKATLCAQVSLGNGVFVGSGAIIIQNITVAPDVIVGAGASVTRDLVAGEICFPARSVIKLYK